MIGPVCAAFADSAFGTQTAQCVIGASDAVNICFTEQAEGMGPEQVNTLACLLSRDCG